MPKYHWDIGDPMLCTEVVFGNGRRLPHRLGRRPRHPGGAVGRRAWPRRTPGGPAQTSLNRVVQGAQGTLGVVTWSSVKLDMMPQIAQAATSSRDDRLDQLIDFAYRVMRLKFADELLILDGNGPGLLPWAGCRRDSRPGREAGPLHPHLLRLRLLAPAREARALPGEGHRRVPPSTTACAWPARCPAPARRRCLEHAGQALGRALLEAPQEGRGCGRSSSSPPWTGPPGSSA